MTSDHIGSGVPEYDRNPFINQLPPLRSMRELFLALQSLPEFAEEERALQGHVRKHLVLRLSHFYLPQPRQIRLVERSDMLVRQGYVSRDLGSPEFMRDLRASAARLQNPSPPFPLGKISTGTASSFALLGASGSGKTTTLCRAFNDFPLVIRHTQPFLFHQVVYLHLQCPSAGGVGQFCLSFFQRLDEILGTDYFNRYSRRTIGVGALTSLMGHVCRLHAIGVLIIDEIQHLIEGSSSPQVFLNFIVTLINSVNVPVILSGTPEAEELVRRTFREARRASGMGSMVWDPMPLDSDWRALIESVWKFQWTKLHVPFTDDVAIVLHSITQGIPDILIKLLIVSQFRAIELGELRKKPESLSFDLIGRVFQEEFTRIHPMIAALKSNDRVALKKFGDLTSFNDMFQAMLDTPATYLKDPEGGTNEIPIAPVSKDPSSADHDQILRGLSDLKLSKSKAKKLLEGARAAHPSGDILFLINWIREEIKKGTPKKRPAKPKSAPQMPEKDLRRLLDKDSPAATTEQPPRMPPNDQGSVKNSGDST